MPRMSIFLLVNNSATVRDTTPIRIYTSYEEGSKGLRDHGQHSQFQPIVLYEYVLQNGSAEYPKCFYRLSRSDKQIETLPVNPSEFRKQHPFLFATQ